MSARRTTTAAAMLALGSGGLMAPLDTATAAVGCSRDGGRTTAVAFENRMDDRVAVLWVDTSCREILYAEIAPGGSLRQPTYAGHVWRVRHVEKRWVLRETVASAGPSRIEIGDLPSPLARSDRDRLDDVGGHQVHVMYALASDGVDRGLDTSGVISRAVAIADRWLVGQTGGPRLRWDTLDGRLDVTFVRLRKSSDELRRAGLFIRDWIEEELASRAMIRPRKIYLVFYDGGSGTERCGGAALPPRLVGQITALYLQGTPSGARPCADNPFSSTSNAPGYWELSMLHEVLHNLGLVAPCAPNHAQGHVADAPTDLMYAGTAAWQPSTLDVGRNDYYGHGRSDCPDLARSAFLDPLPDRASPPPGWRR